MRVYVALGVSDIGQAKLTICVDTDTNVYNFLFMCMRKMFVFYGSHVNWSLSSTLWCGGCDVDRAWEKTQQKTRKTGLKREDHLKPSGKTVLEYGTNLQIK